MTILLSLLLLWRRRCCSVGKRHVVVMAAVQLLESMESGREKQMCPSWGKDIVHGIYELGCHVPERQRAYVAMHMAMGVLTSSWEALLIYR